MTNELRSPVEDVATAIAATVRAKGWQTRACARSIEIWAKTEWLATVRCDSAAQAKRLAEMMTGPSVFEAINLPELPAFPSVRGKA